MEKPASTLMDTIKSFAENNPNLVTGMLAGVAAGGLGGAALTKTNPEDTAGQRVKKRLSNALIGAGLLGGAAGAGVYGMDKLRKGIVAAPGTPSTSQAMQEAVKAWHSNTTRALGGTLLGGISLSKQLKQRAAQRAQGLRSLAMSLSRQGTMPDGAKISVNADTGRRALQHIISSGATLADGTLHSQVLDAGLSARGNPDLMPRMSNKLKSMIVAGEGNVARGLADAASAREAGSIKGMLSGVGKMVEGAGQKGLGRGTYAANKGLALLRDLASRNKKLALTTGFAATAGSMLPEAGDALARWGGQLLGPAKEQ